MSTFQRQYKAKRFGFENAKEGRFLRAEKREESRKSQRAKTFNANRNISIPSPKHKEVPVVKDRLIRLMKWKAEREKRKKLEQMKKKPPFVVGVVHHKIYSPINKQSVSKHSTLKMVRKKNASVSSPPKRITRATQKRLMNKALVEKTTKKPKSVTKVQKRQESFAPADYKFKPPAGLPHIPLFGRTVSSISPATLSRFMSPFVKISEVKVPTVNALNGNINTPSSVRSLKRQNAVDESNRDLTLNVTLTRLEDGIEDINVNASKKKSRKRISMRNKEASGYDESIKILRSRIVTSKDTPKANRSPSKLSVNVSEAEQKKDKTPSVRTRRSSAKITVENKGKEGSQNSVNINRRRSRRSVKFSEKVNSDSDSDKPLFSMTPHIRRSKAKSNEKKRSLTGNLISWDTPEKPPDRIRKSRSKRSRSLI